MKNIEKWIKNNIYKVTTMNPVHFHIDCYDLHNNGSLITEESVSAYHEVIDILENEEGSILPVLVIPLETKDFIDTDFVDFGKITKEDIPEKPSIYLLDRNVKLGYEFVEEYRCPIVSDEIKRSREGVYSYYRVFRDEIMWTHSESEYLRGIYVEFYP